MRVWTVCPTEHMFSSTLEMTTVETLITGESGFDEGPGKASILAMTRGPDRHISFGPTFPSLWTKDLHSADEPKTWYSDLTLVYKVYATAEYCDGIRRCILGISG